MAAARIAALRGRLKRTESIVHTLGPDEGRRALENMLGDAKRSLNSAEQSVRRTRKVSDHAHDRIRALRYSGRGDWALHASHDAVEALTHAMSVEDVANVDPKEFALAATAGVAAALATTVVAGSVAGGGGVVLGLVGGKLAASAVKSAGDRWVLQRPPSKHQHTARDRQRLPPLLRRVSSGAWHRSHDPSRSRLGRGFWRRVDNTLVDAAQPGVLMTRLATKGGVAWAEFVLNRASDAFGGTGAPGAVKIGLQMGKWLLDKHAQRHFNY